MHLSFLSHMSVDFLHGDLHSLGSTHFVSPVSVSLQIGFKIFEKIHSMFEEHGVMHSPFLLQIPVDILQGDEHS